MFAGCLKIIGGDRMALTWNALSGGVSSGTFLGTFWNSGARWIEMDGSQVFEINNTWFNTNGLVGYWKNNANPIVDGNQVLDSSTLANHGTLRTGEIGVNKSTSGKVGAAIAFDGVNDGVDVADQASLRPSEITLSAWVKHASFNPGTVCGTGDPNNRVLLFKRNTRNTTSIDGIGLYGNTSGQFEFAIANAAGTRTSTGLGGNNFPGQWVHVVASFRKPDMKLYVNGILERTAVHNFDLDYDVRPFFMGRSGECGGAGEANIDSFFNGAMDEVSIWNRALSDREVGLLYERQSPRFTGTYTSPIYNSGGMTAWSALRPIPESPAGKPITSSAETAYGSGEVDPTGLVALWHLDHPGGATGFLPTGTIFTDSSGFGNHGTLFDSGSPMAKYTEGKFNEGLFVTSIFNDIRVNASSSLNNLPALSLSVWVRIQTNSSPGAFLAKRHNGTGAGWSIYQDALGKLRFLCGFGTQVLERSSAGPMNIGEWQHVVATWNGQPNFTNVRLYVNGAEISYGPGFDGIGARLDDATEWLSLSSDQGVGGIVGAIDEAAVFNRVLSPVEVQALYQRGGTRLKYQVRSCGTADCSGASFLGPDGTPYTHYSEAMNPFASLPVLGLSNVPNNVFFQYRVYFETDDASLEPKLKDLSVDGSR